MVLVASISKVFSLLAKKISLYFLRQIYLGICVEDVYICAVFIYCLWLFHCQQNNVLRSFVNVTIDMCRFIKLRRLPGVHRITPDCKIADGCVLLKV